MGSWMVRTGMQGFTMAMLTLVFLAVLLIAATLVAMQLAPADAPFWRDLRCAIGVPSQAQGEACIQDQLRRIEEERRRERLEFDGILRERREREAALEEERAAHAAARETLEQQLARLRDIEESVNNFNLFTRRDYQGPGDVHTGVEYPSFVDHQQWSSAWCYWSPPQNSYARVNIGRATPSSGVTWATFNESELAEFGVSAREAEGARRHCVWPEGVS